GQSGCMSQFSVAPKANGSPFNVGTVAKETWFPGAVGKVAVYDYLLSQVQISAHFQAMAGRAPSGSCSDTCTIPVLCRALRSAGRALHEQRVDLVVGEAPIEDAGLVDDADEQGRTVRVGADAHGKLVDGDRRGDGGRLRHQLAIHEQGGARSIV